MKEQITVKAQAREQIGSGAAGRLRRTGAFPAVVYGARTSAIHIQVDRHAFELMLHRQHGERMMLDLEVEGAPAVRVLLKDVQHHPITGQVVHADFQAVALDERFRVEVSIELTGEPVGVTRDGGVLEHLLRQVEIECLPGDLMDEIDVDVSALEIGDHLSVGDIRLDSERYEIVTAPDIAIATVAAPRVEEEEAEGAAEGEEPELVSAEDKDTGEEKAEDA